jgi:hypothetical protein
MSWYRNFTKTILLILFLKKKIDLFDYPINSIFTSNCDGFICGNGADGFCSVSMVVVVSSSLVSRFRLRSVVAIEGINLQERKKNVKHQSLLDAST